MASLIEINPNLDLADLAARFQAEGWIQVRDVLAPDAARKIQDLVVSDTPWGLSWQAEPDEPRYVPAADLGTLDLGYRTAMAARLNEAKRGAAYSYAFYSCPLTLPKAGRRKSPHEQLFEELNGPAFLDLMRTVTGRGEIIKVDGQATLYGPGHHLAAHTDDVPVQGRQAAYVLNLTKGEWRPEWGGYLNFLSDDGDIEVGLRPRFNSLNLFTVPRWHNVSQVLAAAPVARYAVTGWGKDK